MKILILILILIIFYDSIYGRALSFFISSNIKSNIDGNIYPVISSYEDKHAAADIIAKINIFAVDLIRRLKATYLTISPETPEQIKGYEVASILEKRYKSESLAENKPTSDKDTSYTQNKGEVIALCLREKESGFNKFHSLDTLKFVMLHELAHIITPEITHSNLFWTNFRFLLEFCQKQGIYTAPDYNKKNEQYCGMTIRYNPMWDNIRTVSYFEK